MNLLLARFAVGALVLVTLLGLIAPVPSPTRAQVDMANETEIRRFEAQDFYQIDNKISEMVSEGDPVGAELLIVQGGNMVLNRAYGLSDREDEQPMQAGSVFRIRSMTKPILGTAVLMLRDEGRFKLDDPVGRYLPAFDNERHASITIRELLSHTSGMAENRAESGLPMPPWEFESLEALVDAISKIDTNGPSGIYQYSDLNSAILGQLVTIISGIPVDDFIERRIFVPLGMTESYTFFSPEMSWASNMNSTYELSRETCSLDRYWSPDEEQQRKYFRASGGVYSTTADYARFLAVWLNGGNHEGKRFLRAESVEEGRKLHAESGETSGYGLHWNLFNRPSRGEPPAVFGHGGSDGTIAMAFPETDTMVLFFTQSRGSAARRHFVAALAQTPGFERLEFDWRPEIRSQWDAARSADQSTFQEQANRYVGKYRNEAQPEGPGLEFRVDEDQLILQTGDGATARMAIAPDGAAFGQHPCLRVAVKFTIGENNNGSPYLQLATEDGYDGRFLRQPSPSNSSN